jgi:hypothetical protein
VSDADITLLEAWIALWPRAAWAEYTGLAQTLTGVPAEAAGRALLARYGRPRGAPPEGRARLPPVNQPQRYVDSAWRRLQREHAAIRARLNELAEVWYPPFRADWETGRWSAAGIDVTTNAEVQFSLAMRQASLFRFDVDAVEWPGVGVAIVGMRLRERATQEVVSPINDDERFEAPAVYRTGTAGRPSSKHLALAELKRRAAANLLAPTLLAEATALVDWLKETHPDAPRPKPKSLADALRAIYREEQAKPKIEPKTINPC